MTRTEVVGRDGPQPARQSTPTTPASFRFTLLGPLAATVDGRPVELGGRRQRTVLGLVLLHAPREVSTTRLIDAVWPDHPPTSAERTIGSYLSHIRRALRRHDPGAGDLVRSRSNRHVARLEPEQLDSLRFEQLMGQARTQAAGGQLEAALRLVDEALGLWYGHALSDLIESPVITAEANRLESLRFAALELRVDLYLGLGRHDVAVPELQSLTTHHPLHEGLRARQILALYRAGRQADALAVYQDIRRELLDRLGLEPGPELRRLEQAVLNQSPELDWPQPPSKVSPLPPTPGDRPGDEPTPARPHDSASPPNAGTTDEGSVAGDGAHGGPTRVGAADVGSAPGEIDGGPAPADRPDEDGVAHDAAAAGRGAAGSGTVSDVGAARGELGRRPTSLGGSGDGVARLSAGEWVAPTFVGRDAEMARVGADLDQVDAGQSRLVAVGGDAGTGKTRFAQEVARWAGARDFAVLWSWCYEGEGAPAFWPWHQVVDACLEAYGEGVLQGLPTEDRAALGPVLPTRLTDDAPAGPSPESRFSLFQAVIRLLARASAIRPLVVVVDDAHWADAPSLRLLELLAKQAGTARVLTVVTYQGNDRTAHHQLSSLLGGLARVPGVDRLRLHNLQPHDVARYLVEAEGIASAPFAELIYSRTEGNPLFMIEVLDHLRAQGLLADPEAVRPGDVDLPHSVRDLIVRRSAGLSPEARDVLLLMSVIGHELDLRTLERVAPGPAAVDDALEEAIDAGLVVEVDSYEGLYRFSHGLVWEGVYDQVASPRRARWHRAVGEALEHLLGDDPGARIGELAHHFAVAARRYEELGEKAVGYAVASARWALRSLDYEGAVRHYRDGLVMLARVGGDTRARRFELLDGLGEALFRCGDTPRAHEAFLDAHRVAVELDAPELRAQAALGYGGRLARNWHTIAGSMDGTQVELLLDALDHLDEGDSDLRVRLLGQLSEDMSVDSEMERRDELSRAALAMARRLGDPETIAAAMCSRILALWHPRHLEERVRLVDYVEALADKVDHPEIRLFASHHRSVTCLELGDAEGAERARQQHIDLAQRLEQPLFLWQVAWSQALRATMRGDFTAAEDHATAAFELGSQVSDPDALRVFSAQVGLIRLEQARYDEIVPIVEDMVAEDPVHWRPALALLTAAQGHHDRATALLDELVTPDGCPVADDFIWSNGMVLLSEAAALTGHRPAAARLYELLAPYAGQQALSADVLFWGPVARYLGKLATVLGHYDEAQAHLDQALDACARLGASLWLGHARCDVAELLLRRGGRDDAASARALLDEMLFDGRVAAGERPLSPRAVARLQQLLPG